VNKMTDWELTWLGLAAADAGRFAEGVDYVRRGVVYSAEHEGKLHPRTLELRAYLVKALVSDGDTEEAFWEGQDLLRAVQREGFAGTTLEAKASLYLGMALLDQGKLADAAHHLERAQREDRDAEIKSEASPELVRLMLADGRVPQAVALAHKSLEEDRKTLPPVHPYVLVDSLALAQAELRAGHAPVAVATLEEILKTASGADVSPFVVADVKAELARALPHSDHAVRQRALTLASEARATYASAPLKRRFAEPMRKLDDLLAELTR
jgi:tetratricopeptide (TPR) repeat protein